MKHLKKYKAFINESVFKNQFIIRDPETKILYTVEVPDKKKHEIVRMERDAEKLSRVFDEFIDIVKLNLKRLKSHGKDNKLASDLLVKWVRGGLISPKEYDFIKDTAIGNLKLLGIGTADLIIPGTSITLPILLAAASKNGVNLFPRAWEEIRRGPKPNLRKLPNAPKRMLRRDRLESDIKRYSGERRLGKTPKELELEDKIRRINRKLKR